MDNNESSPETENSTPNSPDKKLIAAYMIIGVIVLSLIGLAIYNRNQSPPILNNKPNITAVSHNQASSTPSNEEKNPPPNCTAPKISSSTPFNVYVNTKDCYSFRYPSGDSINLPEGDSLDYGPVTETSGAVKVGGFEIFGDVLATLTPESIQTQFSGKLQNLISTKIAGQAAYYISSTATDVYFVQQPDGNVLEINMLANNAEAKNILNSFEFILPSDQETYYDDGVFIKNGSSNASYEYKDIILSAEPSNNSSAKISILQNDKKDTLIGHALTDCCGGGFITFLKTNDPNIALLHGGSGDAGSIILENNYIVLSTRQILRVYYDNIPEIEVTAINGVSSKLKLITDNSACKGSQGNMLINGISVNGMLSYTFPEPIIVDCVDPSDGIYVPNFDFNIKGVDPSLSKVYFTVIYYTGNQPNLIPHDVDYTFNTNTQTILTGTSQDLLDNNIFQ